MQKKISVIIPVYNGEKHIKRCIDSVLVQKGVEATDLDILLLNDGSKDGSLEILEKYRNEYPEIIRVIDQENVGVAKTRNKGINLAQAEYTMFIDQDDWIDKDYCATLYQAASQTGLDVVAGGYRRPSSQGDVTRTFVPSDDPYGKYTMSAAWAKIHKTEFLKNNKILFFDNKYGEDTVFIARENACTERYLCLNYVGYNWFDNEESVSNTVQKVFTEDSYKALQRLLDELLKIRDSITSESVRKLHDFFIVRTAVYYLLFSGRRTSAVYFSTVFQEIFRWLSGQFPETIHRGWVSIPRGETLIARLAVLGANLIYQVNLVKIFAIVWCKN